MQRQLRLEGGHSLVIGEGNTAYVASIVAAEKMGMRRFCIDLETASKRHLWKKLLIEAVLTIFEGDPYVVMVRDKPSLLAAMASGALHALVRLATIGAGQTMEGGQEIIEGRSGAFMCLCLPSFTIHPCICGCMASMHSSLYSSTSFIHPKANANPNLHPRPYPHPRTNASSNQSREFSRSSRLFQLSPHPKR